jgi:DHA1 family multidrug resistance protein-like MFS transporter
VPPQVQPAQPTSGHHTADDVFLNPSETWALVGSQPLAQLSNMALLPSLAAMRTDLELSYGELGVVVAAFGFARLLVDLPAGGLARRWNPRAVLLLAFALSAGGSFLGVLAANAWQIASIRFVIGIASSVAQAMILAWLVGGAGRAARGRVMARGEAFFSLSGLIIPALGGLLAGSLGWRVAFVLGAVAAAAGFTMVLTLTRSSAAAQSVALQAPSSASAADGGGWRDLRLGGHVLVAAYLATFVVFFCRNGMLNAVFPVLGAERLGIEPFQIGLLFSVINAIGIGAVLLGGRAGDRFGRSRVLVPGLLLLLVAQMLLFAVDDPLTYVVVGLLQGVACFVNPLPTVLLGDALPSRARPQGIAVYRAVSDLAVLCAPAAMGAALERGGFPGAEGVSVLVIAVVTLLIVGLNLRQRQRSGVPR